jgi:N-acetylglucosaminyldiphosphoundecaprenol N-acetyl-beta-D-mannosaminyltransferase
MATADGMPLVWGARALGVRLGDRVTGADLVPAIAERAAARGYSLYLLGATAEVGQRAAAILTERYPGLKIVGVASPPRSSVLEMDRAYVEAIKAAKPDVLLVALGNPKQEKWIGMYGRELGVPVMMGVGGTLDFIAGKTRRAPRWMQRTGLEWVFRLAQEPRRLWRRYVVDLFSFGLFFLRQWWVMRGGRSPAPILPSTYVAIVNSTAVLNVAGRLDVGNCHLFSEQGQQALAQTPYLIVNLVDAAFLDSAAIGALVALTKQARDAGGELWLTAVPEPISRTLTLLRLDRFFAIVDEVGDGLRARAAQVVTPPAQPMGVQGEWTVVKMPRRLDASTAAEVGEMCQALLSINSRLVVDLADTVFLASAGLAILAQAHRQAAAQGGALRVAGTAGDALRVIQMVRFDQFLALYPSVASAIT